jgi:hypothetical protein
LPPRWFAATLLAICSSCGYVGEPLPPLLNIPEAVDDLAAVQRGSKIIVQFTLPELTTEGVAIKPPIQWDLRAGVGGSGEFQMDEWAAGAQTLSDAKLENGRVRCEAPTVAWTGKDVILAVRIMGARGKPSAWSNLVRMKVIGPPTTPTEVKAVSVPQGVRVTWNGAGPGYRVFRRGPGEAGFSVAANTEARQFLDRAVEYGKTYRYAVQAITKAGASEVESELSGVTEAIPEDTLPPAVPGGLTAVATTTTIEIAWERATEADLAGYRIYRAAPGGEFEKIAETAETPSYSDRRIESGKQYRYAVSAFDKAGNESRRSEAIEITAQ